MSISNVESANPVELTHAQPSSLPLQRVRRRAGSWAQLCLATDATMLLTGVFLAWSTSASSIPTAPLSWTIAFALLVGAFFYTRGMYRDPLHLRILDSTRAVVTATALAAAIVVSLRVVLSDSPFVAEQSTRLWLFATVLLVGGRIVISLSEWRARRTDERAQSTLIVGAGKVGRLVAARLRQHPEVGLRPIGFIDEEAAASGESLELPVLGSSWDIARIVEDEEIEHVVVTSSAAPTPVLLRLMTRCEQLGVRTSVVPSLYEKTTEQFTVARLGGLPLISSYSPDPKGWQFAVKYAVDRVAAAVALVLLAPILAVLILAVWISLGRPILFRQRRIGRDGQSFDMFKFRSMAPPAEPTKQAVVLAEDTAPGGVEGADRRTRVGKILRSTSLDELPQLLNVIRGEMSFIGPRPERPEFVEVFEHKVRRYGERHRVKSGITGWAQVNGLRGKTSIADRVEWDNFYIENWSLWFDVKILLLTLVAVARPAAVE